MRKSAMESVKVSFGDKGGDFFAGLNVIQLVGWTAIMIYDGALAANGIFATGQWFWAILIGALIIVWLFLGITNLGKVNTITMMALFILTIVLSFTIFKNTGTTIQTNSTLSFGAAVELSVAMPLSWLPLISDYTKEAKNPVQATAISSIAYGLTSCWMYMIGMGAAIYTQQSDIAQILLKAGFGVIGLLIIVLSTVTTTFLDAYSAGISTQAIKDDWNGSKIAIIVTIIGVIGAILFPMDDITNFLYFIGSVFAPMIAIQIADHFILKHQTNHKLNMIIWIIGFILYRYLMHVDFILGNTFPDMLITIGLCILINKVIKSN